MWGDTGRYMLVPVNTTTCKHTHTHTTRHYGQTVEYIVAHRRACLEWSVQTEMRTDACCKWMLLLGERTAAIKWLAERIPKLSTGLHVHRNLQRTTVSQPRCRHGVWYECATLRLTTRRIEDARLMFQSVSAKLDTRSVHERFAEL
jgi:hypothetical protein